MKGSKQEEKKTGLFGWSADRWISFFAAVASVMAIFVLVWEGCETRRYYRLSVKPFIKIAFYNTAKGAGWDILITGTGPAVIGSFEVTVDDKPQTTWREVKKALQIRGPFYYSIPHNGTVLEKGSSRIFWIEPGAAADSLAIEYVRVKMHLCYCSFYEECWMTENFEGSVTPVEECPEIEKDKLFGPHPFEQMRKKYNLP